jgi:ferrous iron transport protein B
VLYALYWFVGVFGASILVGLLEENLFSQVINPWVVGWVNRLIPVPFLVDLLVGEYGLWTMGMTYALALILPIVMTFFLAFGVLEDSGYLPRLAALSNRLFQRIGLNGKAVLPMVLGLGCVTMATLTTRVLETKRERLLAILLLALAIPCSAQLGVVMGMLAGVSFTAMLLWSGVVGLVLLTIGWLAARIVPGRRTQLLVELPPLRWPVLSNVAIKTAARIEWYLKEVIPLFLVGAALMFILARTGLLNRVIQFGEPLVAGWLGLPPEASAAFLVGFLRRDFGATGLFMMQSQGLLTPTQVVVAMVTITLFIPCIASVMMIAKERSWRIASGMLVLIIPLAFLIGGLLSRVLSFVGWGV